LEREATVQELENSRCSHTSLEQQIVEAVQAVLAAEAKQRKPQDFKRQTFFGVFDLWYYLAISDDKTCWTCEMLNKGVYKGYDLRLMFPWCEIIGEDQILPYVHPNCRCTLLRVTNIQDYLDAIEPSDQELDIF
jgi:hypothetical protein